MLSADRRGLAPCPIGSCAGQSNPAVQGRYFLSPRSCQGPFLLSSTSVFAQSARAWGEGRGVPRRARRRQRACAPQPRPLAEGPGMLSAGRRGLASCSIGSCAGQLDPAVRGRYPPSPRPCQGPFLLSSAPVFAQGVRLGEKERPGCLPAGKSAGFPRRAFCRRPVPFPRWPPPTRSPRRPNAAARHPSQPGRFEKSRGITTGDCHSHPGQGGRIRRPTSPRRGTPRSPAPGGGPRALHPGGAGRDLAEKIFPACCGSWREPGAPLVPKSPQTERPSPPPAGRGRGLFAYQSAGRAPAKGPRTALGNRLRPRSRWSEAG